MKAEVSLKAEINIVTVTFILQGQITSKTVSMYDDGFI